MAPLLPVSNGNGSGSSIKSGRKPSRVDSDTYFGGGEGGGRGAEAYALPRGERGVPLVLRRLLKFGSMDFELAFWQLTYLVVAPRRVYKQTYHHKQTKNVWARDDPAMLILISGCLILSGIAWSLIYRKSTLSSLSLILLFIFRDFLLTSLLIALVLYIIANRLLVSRDPNSHSTPADSTVEYTYAFDVAVNSFFPAFLTLHVGLIVMAGVVVKDNWVCLFVGNTLFLVAGIQYTYITYLGYNALPFVARSELLLAPLLPLFTGYLISLLGFNIARHGLALYFGQPWN